MSYMVSLLKSDFGVTVNKQSMNERFNENCETYVKAVLKEVWSEKLANIYDTSFLSGFSRILIKDSTKFICHQVLNIGSGIAEETAEETDTAAQMQEYPYSTNTI